MMHILRQRGAMSPDVLGDIAWQVGIGITKANRALWWISLVGVLAFCLLAPVLIVMFVKGWINRPSLVASFLPPSTVWLGLLALWLGTRSVRHQRIGTVMLRNLRCPHCGYDIRGLPTDPDDGATVCPECGCAWALDKAGPAQSGANGDCG
jgi:hypothetical protein